jgi:DNA-binding NarL/FixJ family response regulator
VVDDARVEQSKFVRMAASAGSDSITVVLADDHTVMRSGLRLLLEAEDDLDVRAEAGDIQMTFRHVRGHQPSVLVLDLNMRADRASRRSRG